MRGYFQRLENNGYYPVPKGVPTKWWGRTRDLVKWLFGFTPDHARGKHGFTGWLHTSVADVSLGLHDKQLITVLSGALWQSRFAGLDRAWTLVRFFDADLLQLAPCKCCGGHFVAHAYDPTHDFVCGLCNMPSRAGKTRRAAKAALADAG